MAMTITGNIAMNNQFASPEAAIKKVIEICGGQSALSRKLTERGTPVAQPSVNKWASGKSIPKLEYAIGMSVLSEGAVRVTDIRPDLPDPKSMQPTPKS